MATTTKATKHDDRIKALETKLAQAKALRAKEEARARAAEAAAKRTADTRRKILAGAAVLAEIEHDPERSAWLNSVLARQLTRADDRALFGLDPLRILVEPPAS
ncbi:mobilization protein [Sphaerotilus montanus]|uniref:mobilization protein n=1 Tax=Sphaerotilus montanus TaxID=522889 RepID=UPI0015D7319C|nr:mobilization protein [Sphaerotilus montanus]NZD59356.1 mobilization protein [Sphaerotilus montanus]